MPSQCQCQSEQEWNRTNGFLYENVMSMLGDLKQIFSSSAIQLTLYPISENSYILIIPFSEFLL